MRKLLFKLSDSPAPFYPNEKNGGESGNNDRGQRHSETHTHQVFDHWQHDNDDNPRQQNPYRIIAQPGRRQFVAQCDGETYDAFIGGQPCLLKILRGDNRFPAGWLVSRLGNA